MGNDDTRRSMDEVFTGRNKGKRQMSSFHSLFSLDVTHHLFIFLLNGGSKGGGYLKVEISSDTKYRTLLVTKRIKIIVLCRTCCTGRPNWCIYIYTVYMAKLFLSNVLETVKMF